MIFDLAAHLFIKKYLLKLFLALYVQICKLQ